MDFVAFLPALLGGALIGLGTSLVLASHGRIAGISGILDRALSLRGTGLRGVDPFSLWFLGGLALGGFGLSAWAPELFGSAPELSPALLLATGALVGFGARLSGGCTSGHGICGISRLSLRSLLAVAIFMLSGAVAVFAARSWFGGGS